jgi:membrane fusion protein, macrolide-specific efflux system
VKPIRRAGRALRRHPRWSALTLAVIVAAVAIGSYFIVSGGNSSASAAATDTTETVSTGTIRQSVSASGTLAPAEEDNVSFSSSGVVTAVSVTEGQKVKKGQALASIDSASLAASVAQAKASVASDQAKVDDDQTNDVTSTQLAADQAALAAAQNQLTSAEAALAGATLVSPITGVVASMDLTVGQSVSGSSGTGSSSSGGSNSASSGGNNTNSASSSSSSTQIQVISTDAWVVNASVDATSVGLIKVGNQAQLAVTGADSTVYGTISSIAVVSSSSSGTASYPVVIGITGSPAGMHDGANVTATLIYKQLSNVVVVPSTALHRTSAGGEYVEKVTNGKTVQTTVQIGTSSGAQTQIISGINAGDTIIVPRLQVGRGGSTSRTGTGSGTGTGSTGNFPEGGFGGGGFGGGGFGGGGFGGGGFGGAGTAVRGGQGG